MPFGKHIRILPPGCVTFDVKKVYDMFGAVERHVQQVYEPPSAACAHELLVGCLIEVCVMFMHGEDAAQPLLSASGRCGSQFYHRAGGSVAHQAARPARAPRCVGTGRRRL